MRLIFVYNAVSGNVNTVLDILHKIASPATYNCMLCAITFGKFSENKIWKNFREHSAIEMEFYHKDEFLQQFKSKWLQEYEFPIILSEENNELQIFMSSEALKQLKSTEDLIAQIKKRQLAH